MVAQDGEHEIVVDKSRFICHVKRVYNDQDAMEFIKEIKKIHWNATHNCSAYQVGDFNEIQKANDDGEPSGTAGVPMLEVLRKQGIKNCVVVVTRYFGGIKLGAGGLIRAYAGSVNHAIEAVGLVEFINQRELILNLDYSLYDSLQRFLIDQKIKISDSEFLSDIKVKCFIDEEKVDEVMNLLTETFNGKIIMKKGDRQQVEVEFLS